MRTTLVPDYDVEVEPLYSSSNSLFRTLYYALALRSAINYAKLHGLEGRFTALLEEKASKTVFVVIATHNPLLVSTPWDKVGDVRTYYVYRGARGATTAAEVDVERLVREGG